MCGAILPLPKYAFMAWCSVKKQHKDNFTLTSFPRSALFICVNDRSKEINVVASLVAELSVNVIWNLYHKYVLLFS
jgi:hypothetical protein